MFDDDDLKEAWELFAADGRDALDNAEEAVLALEAEHDPEVVNGLYRAMHTLKGNARVMGLEHMERFAHHAEDMVGLVRDEGMDMDRTFFDLLLGSLDLLRAFLELTTQAGGDVDEPRAEGLGARIHAYAEARRAGTPFEDAVAPAGGPSIVASVSHSAPPPGPSLEPEASIIPPRPGSIRVSEAPPRDSYQPPAAPSQHPDVFGWEGEGPPSAPPPPPVGDPDADSPPDPATDPEYVKIFLDLAQEQLGALSVGVEKLFDDDPSGVDDVRGAIDGMAHAAEHMGYAEISQTLEAITACVSDPSPAVAALQALEEQLVEKLARLQGNALGDHMGSGGPSMLWIFRSFHARRMGRQLEALADASARLGKMEEHDNFEVRHMCDNLVETFGSIHQGFKFHQLEAPSEITLTTADILGRIASGEQKMSEGVVDVLDDLAALLPVVLGHAEAGTEVPPDALARVEKELSGLVESTLGRGATASSEDEALMAAIPASMRRDMTPEQLADLKATVEAGAYVYEAQAYMGQDEDFAAAILMWLEDLGTVVASAADAFADDPLSEMLVKSTQTPDAAAASLAGIDPDGRARLAVLWAPEQPEGAARVLKPFAPEREGGGVHARIATPDGFIGGAASAAAEASAPAPVSAAAPVSLSPLSAEAPLPPSVVVEVVPPAATATQAAAAPPAVSAQAPAPSAKPSASPGPGVTKAAPAGADDAAAAKPKAKPAKGKKAAAGKAKADDANTYIRMHKDKVDHLMSLAGEINLSIGGVLYHPDLEDLELEGFSTVAHRLEMLVRELQDAAAGLGLTPVGGVFSRLRRLVRDLQRQTGKEIRLEVDDGETEMDRLLVDKIYEPLMHIIRNSADHGLEPSDEREAAGKPRTGTIRLTAEQQGGSILIQVQDDGRGLNKERIVARALDRGLITSPDISDEEAWQLIFKPGFSTAEQVSNLSGRGVGMDVVHTTMDQIKARVTVQSAAGKGTTVGLHLPLTLAFAEVIVVEVEKRLYVIPMSSVSNIFRPEDGQLADVSAEGATVVRVLDELIPVCWLERFYDHHREVEADTIGSRVVVSVHTTRGKLAIPIDRMHGAERVTMKPLPEHMSRIRAGAGCGVLRSGEVAVALDCELLYDERAA